MPAFEEGRITYVTVRKEYASVVPGERFLCINDATRWGKVPLLLLAMRIVWVLLCERPDVVITTGAAPGFFAVMFGKFIGARTIWLDSIANVDEMSKSGKMAGRYADLWLTQWPHLAEAGGPEYAGTVL